MYGLIAELLHRAVMRCKSKNRFLIFNNIEGLDLGELLKVAAPSLFT